MDNAGDKARDAWDNVPGSDNLEEALVKGQAIPVVGVVIGAGLNASYLQSVGRDAELAYRMRFLAEKHGLDPSDLAPPPTASDATTAARDYIDIQEIVDAELRKKPGPAAVDP